MATQLSLVRHFVKCLLGIRTGSIVQALIHVLIDPLQRTPVGLWGMTSLCTWNVRNRQFANCSISLAEVICIHLSTQYILFLHVSSLVSTSEILACNILDGISQKKIISDLGVQINTCQNACNFSTTFFFSTWNTGYAIVGMKGDLIFLYISQST